MLYNALIFRTDQIVISSMLGQRYFVLYLDQEAQECKGLELSGKQVVQSKADFQGGSVLSGP